MKILNNMFKNIPILFTLLLIYCRLCNGEYFMCRIAETSPDRNGIPLVFYYTSEETNILLVYIYYFCLFIMIALLIAHIALDLTDYFFSCFKQSLSQFDEIYQNHHIVYVVFKFIGVMFIALIIMIPVSWKVETILDYNSLAEKIIWNYDNYENVPVTIESVSTVVTWDNTIIIITGYVLIYSLLSLYLKKSNSFLNRISFYVFLPIYPFDVFFAIIFTEEYFDEKSKAKVHSLVKKLFQIKGDDESFILTIVNTAFANGKLVIKTLLSYIYISVMLYPLVKHKVLHDIYVRDIFRGSLILLLVGILFITWFSIVDVAGYIFKTPKQFYNWPNEIMDLYDSHIKVQENYQTLKNEYETMKQNDKDWIGLFVHVLKTRSSLFSVYLEKYYDQDFIPCKELLPEVEDFGNILAKCFQLEDAVFDREVDPDEKTPAYFLRYYKESNRGVPSMLKPYISSGRISLNMHGLENEFITIDVAKFENIMSFVLENATKHALDNTVIAIDFVKENDQYLLTVSNIIDSAKENEILARIDSINEFWDTRIFPSHDNNKVCLGLILAKIYAQNMRADLTYQLENHLRFIVKLSFT